MCIALIAACLPTIRPLFSGNCLRRIIGSIRSIFSLNSLNDSRSGIPGAKKEGYVRTIGEDRVCCQSKELQNGLSTEITRSNSGRAGADGQQIMVTHDISFKEEHELPWTRGGGYGYWVME